MLRTTHSSSVHRQVGHCIECPLAEAKHDDVVKLIHGTRTENDPFRWAIQKSLQQYHVDPPEERDESKRTKLGPLKSLPDNATLIEFYKGAGLLSEDEKKMTVFTDHLQFAASADDHKRFANCVEDAFDAGQVKAEFKCNTNIPEDSIAAGVEAVARLLNLTTPQSHNIKNRIRGLFVPAQTAFKDALSMV